MHSDRAPSRTLEGRIIGTYFAATSTRTRSAFTAGALRLGAAVISYGPEDLQLNTGETFADTGRVLGSMIDALVARMPSDDQAMLSLAVGDLAVINAMSASEHPTQALSDLSCLYRRSGRVRGTRVLYLGEGNNTAAALTLALALAGGHLDLRTPAGYGVPSEIYAGALRAAKATGASISQRHDLDELPGEVDVIYTTRWQTTGTQKTDPDWREHFAPFRITANLLRRYPSALFMHDLPAHRGEEVEANVIDGPQSIVFEQAAMKMTSAMAVLEWCLLSQAEKDALT